MTASTSAYNSRISFRAIITEKIEDSVSMELMAKAVTVFPCGHIFNEDTIIKCLSREKLCPLDRKLIEKYVPNFIIRDLVEATLSQEVEEEKLTEEAQTHFLRAKKLSEKGEHKEVIAALLKALQLSPNYEKTQAYLEFCLQSSLQPTPSQAPKQQSSIPHPPSSQEKENIERKSTSESSKEGYINLLLILLEVPQIQNYTALKRILANQVEELMNQETEKLTEKQNESFKWSQKLFAENKVRQFVAEKLQQIHGGASVLNVHNERGSGTVGSSSSSSSSNSSSQTATRSTSSISRYSLGSHRIKQIREKSKEEIEGLEKNYLKAMRLLEE